MKVAVIGGGIGGLVAAYRLVEAGVDAQVLEAEVRPGGVLGTSRVDGFVREHAATAVLSGARDGLADLCDELGVDMDAASPAARRRWIWIDGRLRALPTNPLAFARSDLLTWRGKLQLLGEPFRPSRRMSAAGDESVHEWAARRFGPEVARAIIAPFVTGVYAADAHDIGLEAGFPRLAALEERGGVVRGVAATVRDKVRDQVRDRVMHVIGRRGEGERGAKAHGAAGKRPTLVAPRAGMQTVVDALAARLGDRVQRGVVVKAVEPDAHDSDVTVTTAAGREAYDAAVLAVPSTTAAALVGDAVPVLASRLSALHRAPAVIVFLGYDRAAIRHPLDGFGFLVAQGEDLRVLGVVFESVVWPDRAPAGSVLFRCIMAGARDPSAYDLDDAALLARARADVEQVVGATAGPRHASVVRWREGVAQYPVGHVKRVAELDALAQSRRLVLAGASYHGAAINDLCADARRIADVVARWH